MFPLLNFASPRQDDATGGEERRTRQARRRDCRGRCAARPRGRTLARRDCLLAGEFLPPVDFFIVNVALPSIHESLRARPSELQLVISVYAAGYAVGLITGGLLGDLYGRRRLFLCGMAGFPLANLICGLATTPPQLLVGPARQGLAASMVVPQVLASLRGAVLR
ncbi:MAG: MFS transporter [Acetobacteraceae bacterium]|nr:MFS transporter [Acetobacteraceae bacterium]